MQGYLLPSCLVYLAFDFISDFQLRILSMMNNNPVNFLYVVDSKAFNLSVIRLLPPTPWIESCSVQDNCPVLKNLPALVGALLVPSDLHVQDFPCPFKAILELRIHLVKVFCVHLHNRMQVNRERELFYEVQRSSEYDSEVVAAAYIARYPAVGHCIEKCLSM